MPGVDFSRLSLPVPDVAFAGTVLYDAKDPEVDFGTAAGLVTGWVRPLGWRVCS